MSKNVFIGLLALIARVSAYPIDHNSNPINAAEANDLNPLDLQNQGLGSSINTASIGYTLAPSTSYNRENDASGLTHVGIAKKAAIEAVMVAYGAAQVFSYSLPPGLLYVCLFVEANT